MPEERPPEEHDSEDEEQDEDSSPEAPEPRIPPSLPPDEWDTKRFMVPGRGPSLRVRAYGGDIARQYAPVAVLADLAEHIARVIKGFNGGRAMLYALLPGNSMDIYLGDPSPEDVQSELPLEQTHGAASVVADLIELDDDELVARALELSPASVRGYDELARFVASQGITLDWQPEGQPSRTLAPDRAERQHRQLSAQPPSREREMTLNGVLYRLIEDPATKRGRIGIGLFGWSLTPPGYPVPPCKVFVEFEGAELHERIKALIAEAVEATVVVHEPRLGSAVGYERARLSLTSIEHGKGDPAEYGEPLFELDEE